MNLYSIWTSGAHHYLAYADSELAARVAFNQATRGTIPKIMPSEMIESIDRVQDHYQPPSILKIL